DVPTRQRRQRLRLPLITLAELLPIGRGGWTLVWAYPRMPQDLAGLKGGPVRRFLEDQVLRKVSWVIADVYPRKEDVMYLTPPGFPAGVLPEYAEAAEFFAGKGVGGTGVTPVHVPGIFQKYAALILAFYLLRKQVAIEVPELV